MKDWFLLRDPVQYCTNQQCLCVFRCICLCIFVGTDYLQSEVYRRWRLARQSALADPSQSKGI